ncbi:MAG: rubrerythrin, partial [Methylobacteriaceae bacterium]|nr:rubrerythrin [Methylobacteriaceae bacterium]
MAVLSLRPQKTLSDLTDREVLALAIQSEEEDGRIYRDFAETLRADYPA